MILSGALQAMEFRFWVFWLVLAVVAAVYYWYARRRRAEKEKRDPYWSVNDDED